MAEQKSILQDYETPYKFTGKELDVETGLYYFGARYYDPKVSIWMSVDPLANKYPNANPYNYCFENPLALVDPDGRGPKPPAYYMNRRGFFADGVKIGPYIGNVKPTDDRYMELIEVRGRLYHKNGHNKIAAAKNAINGLFGGDDDYFVEKKEYSVEEETNNDLIRFGAEWAVTGLIFKGLSGLAGKLLTKAGSFWKINALQRGFVYEKMMNLKGSFSVSNYPVIDAFFNGVATSIKTLNLAAKSYGEGNAVFNTLKGYINKLAEFEGANWGGINTVNQIKKKVLEVGIPGGATEAQIMQINKAVQYGAENGVKVNVRVIR